MQSAESCTSEDKSSSEQVRRLENLRLARAELSRQEAATEHPVRQEQIRRALADIDRQLAELN